MKTSSILKFALREFGSQKFKMLIYGLSISIGIAALFATGSLKNDLLHQVNNETKNLIGGDLVVRGFSQLPDSVFVDLKSKSSSHAIEKSFASMVVFQDGGSRLVNIRAISKAFPIVGSIEDHSGNSGDLGSQSKKASVAHSLAIQYDVALGDSIRVGNSYFEVVAIHEKAPGQSGIAATVAPTVFISEEDLSETGLVRKGSRIRNSFYFNYAVAKQVSGFKEKYGKQGSIQGLRFEDLNDGQRRLGRIYNNLFRFLNLSAFISLVLGGIGIGGAIDLYLAEKRKMVAVLKCLGFQFNQISMLFVFQILLLGLIGSILGIMIGAGIQQVMPAVMQGFLIETIQVSIHWDMVAISLFLGLVISLLFGLKTLIPLLNATPMMALRSGVEEQKGFNKINLIVRSIQLIALLCFSWYLAGDFVLSVIFIALLAFLMFVLGSASVGLRKLARKGVALIQSFELRYAVNALYRPQNQTILVVSTIGLSVILVLHLFLVRTSILQGGQMNQDASRPNLIIFDINEELVEPISDYLAQQGGEVNDPIAVVPMRMHDLKGRSVFKWKEDSLHEIPSHVFDREYRVTERSVLGVNETLLEGEWPKQNGELIPISIEQNYAKQAELEVGDVLSFNVFGSILKTEVAAIRQVDFTQMRESFTIVFPEGALSGAPVMYALTINVPDSINLAQMQSNLVDRFTNISVIDLNQIFETVAAVAEKIETAIQFMFGFTAVTGLLVLLNSLFLSRYQRLKENAVLRTLGALSGNLTRINIYEFLILGLLAVSLGLILSVVVTWVLMITLFKIAFQPELAGALLIVGAVLFMVLLMGVLNSRSLKNVSPMRILKSNG